MEYAIHRFDRFFDSFWINCNTIDCSLSIIKSVLTKKSIQELFLQFASHLYVNRDMLMKLVGESSREMLDLFMLRNC